MIRAAEDGCAEHALVGCATYIAISTLAFGGLIQPITVSFFAARLSAPYWPLIVLACLSMGLAALFLPSRLSILRIPGFLTVSLFGSLFLVGIYVDHRRNQSFIAFHADHSFQRTFLQSVRDASSGLQLSIHGGAMKNCVPFGYSYRRMNFYRLPPNVAVNVLPRDWLARCRIVRR